MIKVAICDDDPIFLKMLEQMIDQIAKSSGLPAEFVEFETGESLMQYLKQNQNHIDVLFLDVMLGDSNGLEFGQMIRERYPFIQTVFISADIDYSLDVFDLEAVYFLNKPISIDRLTRAWELALRRISNQKESFLRINSRGHHLNIPFKDILYLESERRIIIVHRLSTSHQFYAQLDDIELTIPDYFIRCHQSYLVNMQYIASLAKGRCQISNGQIIPIAQKRRAITRRQYLQFVKDQAQIATN
ncbi:MAG: LytTR family DNA-binding domain-containing protein [Eubacteriales bacterium]|nr:LytTR family DNA-binding domain-containing protein [Eubacteriales bacterium]